uniref:Protein Y32H12A.8 n=1 Tax=Haemonchus contortus TaxID=6289 RepID=W6NLP1_HAECO
MVLFSGMLDQLELHTAVAAVKKYSWIKRINQRSLEGTHFRLSHRGCTGQTLKCRCVKCYAVCGGTCSVCDGPLLKMNWFCRKCHHAGHPHHILEWFTTERICPVGDCLCECGTAVAQSPDKKKIIAPRKTRRDLFRKRETNCYQPSSKIQFRYESSTEEDSDSTTKCDDNNENSSTPRFSIGKMRLGLMKSDSSQSSSREGKSKRQRISTLPIEHDFLERALENTVYTHLDV